MKNITLSLPEDLLKQGRAYAAKHGTTLNSLIRKLLTSTVESGREAKAKQVIAEMQKLKSHQKRIDWNREDLYDR